MVAVVTKEVEVEMLKKIVEQARMAGINTHKFEGLSRKAQVRRMKKAMADRNERAGR